MWTWIMTWRPELITAAAASGNRWFSPADAGLHISSRSLWTQEGKLLVIWPGTSIKGRFTGPSLSVEISDSGQTDYQVIIDGDLQNSRILDTKAGSHVYPLAKDLANAAHSFEIFRRTETFSGPSEIAGFFVESGHEFLPWTPEASLSLAFYGDSQTVGACNECGEVEQWDDLREHNHLLSYAALVTRMLNAESETIAVSGIGLTEGFQSYRMTEIWNRILPSPAAAIAEKKDREPEIIFVNLGQNDWSKAVGESFAPAYGQFLRNLRGRHPEAFIVALLGAMDSAHDPRSPYPLYIRDAVAKEKDARMMTYTFHTRTWSHPRVKDHLLMAQELLDFIRTSILPQGARSK